MHDVLVPLLLVTGLFVAWHLLAGWAQRRIDRIEQRRRGVWQAPPAPEAAPESPLPSPPRPTRTPGHSARREAAESGLH
jgi:hypothetical protein